MRVTKSSEISENESEEETMQRRANDDFPHVPYVPFESYCERFKEFFTMKREDGIIEVRMHTDGGVAMWDYGHHNGWGKVFKAVGQDPENEVLILGGTGDQWIGPVDMNYALYMLGNMMENRDEFAKSTYDHQYLDGGDLIWPMLYDIHIPTIGCINGPTAGHTEFPLLCDVTLAAPDADFFEGHFSTLGTPSGDGLYLVFQEVFGTKRAANMVMLGQRVTAQQALECGAVAEVIERDKLFERAWDLAHKLMKFDRYGRRLQHEINIQRWRRVINADYNMHFMAEEWGQLLNSPETLKAATSKITSFDTLAEDSKL